MLLRLLLALPDLAMALETAPETVRSVLGEYFKVKGSN
jgi:hypothetical protein